MSYKSPAAEPMPPQRMQGAYTHDRALEDLPGIKHALESFLQSHMVECEDFCHASDPNKERLYFASGYGLIQCVKALMSYEDEDLLAAIGHTKHGNVIAQQHRKKPVSLTTRIAGFVVGSQSSSGVGWVKSMTVVERHAELIYAETLFEKALLGIVYSGDWLAFIKEALNLRTTFNTYRLLYKYLTTVDAEADARGEGPEEKSIDPDFRSGVLLGAGLSNIIVSLMPGRLLSIVELFGFTGDRLAGLDMLYRAGGWRAPRSSPSSEQQTVVGAKMNGNAQHLDDDEDPEKEPLIDAAHEGVRRSICDMALLIFHLALSSFTSTGVSIPMASRILQWNLLRFPKGVFFLFGRGRLSLVQGHPRDAIASYRAALETQSQYRNLHQISWWEMAVAHSALWELEESLVCWRRLEVEATWSKACYAYGIASCLIQIGGEENIKEAAKQLEKVPSLVQRIAGKSIPMEKFIARKARKFKTQSNRLTLPALEFAYLYSGIGRAPPSIIFEKMLPAVREAQKPLDTAEGNPEKYYGGGKGSGYWDDLCLVTFLEAVCYRFLAHAETNVIVDPDEKPIIAREEAESHALTGFKRVLQNGHKIELDHQLVYYTHYELGRLHARMGNKDEARKELELVLSGKPLEANASARKGKYSLESVLIMRTNAAVEALESSQPV